MNDTQAPQQVRRVSPAEAHKRLRQNDDAVLIDVRTPFEFAQVHAEYAKHIPLTELKVAAIRQETDQGHEVYMICQTGGRAQQAAMRCIREGLPNVAVVEGGTKAWAAADLPTVRHTNVISLERQVRIAAGSLVLLGALLGLIHPIFLVIPIFVGAGLVFAGVTDFCGMALLLAKAPWNRVPDPSTSQT